MAIADPRSTWLCWMCAGDMRDLAGLHAWAATTVDAILPAKERTRLMRSWGALWDLLPSGGDTVWGGTHGAPDDSEERSIQQPSLG